MTPWRPTKEMVLLALALAVSVGVVRARLAVPVSAGPLPKVPPIELPAEVAKEGIPAARPRLVPEPRATEGRDPFAASDIWEDPVPPEVALPPELPESRTVPVLSIGGGRAVAPRPPKVASLPTPAAPAPPSPTPASGGQKP